MGFSLSRALQGATVGAAHAAGEIFDGMIAEERKQREAEAAAVRQREADTYRADLIMDRERSRDEIKEARAKKDLEGLSTQMKEIRATVREQGLSPDTYEGMKVAAGLADEKGYTAIADKWRVRMETERSHMANEEGRRIQQAAIAESRAGRKREGMDAEERAAMNRIMRQADRLVIPGARDENGKVIGDPDKDAANAAVAWAESERDKGRSYRAIVSDMAQITEGFIKQPDEMKKMPSIKRFDASLAYFQMPEEKRAELSKPKPAAAGTSQTTGIPVTPKKADTGGGIWGAIKGTLGKAGQDMEGDVGSMGVPAQW